MDVPEIVKNHAIAAGVIGIIEIVLSIIIIICSIVIAVKVSIATTLTPYWAGLPYLITGILGMLIIFKRKLCLMIAFLVCNIVIFIVQGIACIIVAIVLAIYAAYADGGCNHRYNIFNNKYYCDCKSGDHTWTFETTNKTNCDIVGDISTTLYVLFVFLTLAALASLAGSIVGCIGTCCRGSAQPGVVLQPQPQPHFGATNRVVYNQPPTYQQSQYQQDQYAK